MLKGNEFVILEMGLVELAKRTGASTKDVEETMDALNKYGFIDDSEIDNCKFLVSWVLKGIMEGR